MTAAAFGRSQLPPLIENCIIRRARKSHRCHGDGAHSSVRKHAEGHVANINPGDTYMEYVGEVGAFQTGIAYCLPCTAAFFAKTPDRYLGTAYGDYLNDVTKRGEG